MRNVFGFDTDHTTAFEQEARHLGLEMHFATALKNGITHGLDDTRQFVGTDMRMGIGKDIGRCAMLTEYIQDLLYRTTLLGAGIQLAIGIGACPTLTKAVVALAINLLGLGNLCQIAFAFTDILAAFQYYRAYAELYQSQGSKQSTRAGTHDNSLWSRGHIRIMGDSIFVLLWLFVDIAAHFQVHEYRPLAGIDAATENAHGNQGADIESVLVSQPTSQRLLIGRHMRLHPYLILLNHSLLNSSLISSISSSSNHFERR